MNPYGLEPDTRLDWSFFTDLDDAHELDEAEVAYFVGCTTAYKGANHEVAFSICSILEKIGENWTLLGEDEWCCGAPNLMAGKEEETREYAKYNVELLESKKVKRVITGCSGCFRMLRFEYPILIGRNPNFEVIHAVQYLHEQLVKGNIKVEKGNEKVIYHDPCELGRLGGILKEPREALRYISSEILEFDEHGYDSKCCGGGGLLQAVDNEMRLNIVKEKLDEAVEKGAKMLVSACPACKLAFVDGVREFKHDIEVYDIHELVAKKLGVLE
jgi:Fe-S oxidoreductase